MSSEEFCALIEQEDESDNQNTEIVNVKEKNIAKAITSFSRCALSDNTLFESTSINNGNGSNDNNSNQNNSDTTNFKQCTLIGLHTCGDLASTMLKLFQKTEHIKNIVSVSCCYFRMTLQSELTENKENMRNRDDTVKSKVCCPLSSDEKNHGSRLCCCDFSLRTFYSNLLYLKKMQPSPLQHQQHQPQQQKDNNSTCNNEFYGFPLSQFLHEIPVTPLKYKSFETACHFLGDYADKLIGMKSMVKKITAYPKEKSPI